MNRQSTHHPPLEHPHEISEIRKKPSLLHAQNYIFYSNTMFLHTLHIQLLKGESSPLLCRRIYSKCICPKMFFAQRERVKFQSCPKKCYFHSPLEQFWLTVTSSAESWTITILLHCMKTNKNKSKTRKKEKNFLNFESKYCILGKKFAIIKLHTEFASN